MSETSKETFRTAMGRMSHALRSSAFVGTEYAAGNLVQVCCTEKTVNVLRPAMEVFEARCRDEHPHRRFWRMHVGNWRP